MSSTGASAGANCGVRDLEVRVERVDHVEVGRGGEEHPGLHGRAAEVGDGVQAAGDARAQPGGCVALVETLVGQPDEHDGRGVQDDSLDTAVLERLHDGQLLGLDRRLGDPRLVADGDAGFLRRGLHRFDEPVEGRGVGDDEPELGDVALLQLLHQERRLGGIGQRRREVGLEVGEALLVHTGRQVRNAVLGGVLRAGGDLVGAATADEHEGAFVLDHLPADLHRLLRVERVVPEDHADVASEELLGRALGQVLPVDVLADLEARLRDR